MVLLTILTWLALAGAAVSDDFPRGEIVDPVPTIHDSGETFALYLPSAYTTERKWPILFVLDPRSRGRMAAELFRDGAERFGYILVSSNSTRSDSLPEEDPNARAMVALLRDAMTRFAADERRVYIAGFSGTARYAWSVGFGLEGKVAGIIACGGALPGPLEKWGGVSFAFFGAAGETDFNYREMHWLDDALDATPVVHRVDFFPGGHRWATPELLAEALAWMDLQAMKKGTRETSSELVEELYARAEAEARRLEDGGELYAASRRWSKIAEDFGGLRDVSVARRKTTRLEELPEVVRDAGTTRAAVRREIAYRQLLDSVLANLATDRPVPPARVIESRLKIPQLLKQARGDSTAARSAQRQLESAYVHTAFYLPRRLQRSGEHERAIVSLEVATAIKPEHWRPWYALAVAYAGAGRKSKAVESLQLSVETGYSNLERLETDPDLDSIRGEKGYRRIVEELRTQKAPG